MPIIKPAGRHDKELCRFKLDVGIMNKVRQYCDWADVKKLDDFFQQAAEYILSKDRDWVSHINRADIGTNSDKPAGTPDATADQ